MAALLVSPSADARPVCAGVVEVEHASVARIEYNGALILDDGRAALLEGIRLPRGTADRAPVSFANAALAELEKLTLGRALSLMAVPPKEDRYDRIRAQAFDGDDWLQLELLRRGLARVSISPDRTECAAELFSAETNAREAHAGIWSSPAYAVRSGGDLAADTGTFQLLQGKVLSANVRDGRAWLQFNWGAGTAALIDSDDLKTYHAMGVDPRGYEGKTILIRGIVQNQRGPLIEIANPMQVEVIAP